MERWNPHARIRQDLFGGLDVLALTEEPGVLGIQATSFSNRSSRIKKLRELMGDPNHPLSVWIQRGNRIEVWAWRKVQNRWTVDKTPCS